MKELLKRYREYLKQLGTRARNIYEDSPDGYCQNARQADAHVMWMLNQMGVDWFAQDAGKFNRWLGFVQGVLWVTGMYSLNQLRDQTREALYAQQRADVMAGRILD